MSRSRSAQLPHTIAAHDTPFDGCPFALERSWWRARATRVKDGDTAVMLIDLGDGHYLATPVRYESIDCWESHGAFPAEHLAKGAAAAAYNRELVERQWIRLYSRLERDDRGRILGDPHVWNGAKVPLIDVVAQLRAKGFEKVKPAHPERSR